MMVDILLASYNGGKYIRSQILSIIAQSYENWRLIIHDDGSTDETIGILRELSQIDSRIVIIDDEVKCGGAANNFLHLLKFSTAPYIMFCDQDDIWFDNKISVMLAAIKKYSDIIPTVVYSDAYVWKPSIGISGTVTLTFPNSLKSFLFCNGGIQGCAALFNTTMKDLLLKWEVQCAMHDHVLQLLGLTVGKVEYLHIPLMLYRQHQKNVTGEANTEILNLKRMIQNSNLPVVSYSHYLDIKYFSEIYKNLISEADGKIINIYIDMINYSKLKKMLYVCLNRFNLYNSTLMLLLKIFFRKYSDK